MRKCIVFGSRNSKTNSKSSKVAFCPKLATSDAMHMRKVLF